MEKQAALAALCGLMDHVATTGDAITIHCRRGGLFSIDVQDMHEPG